MSKQNMTTPTFRKPSNAWQFLVCTVLILLFGFEQTMYIKPNLVETWRIVLKSKSIQEVIDPTPRFVRSNLGTSYYPREAYRLTENFWFFNLAFLAYLGLGIRLVLDSNAVLEKRTGKVTKKEFVQKKFTYVNLFSGRYLGYGWKKQRIFKYLLYLDGSSQPYEVSRTMYAQVATNDEVELSVSNKNVVHELSITSKLNHAGDPYEELSKQEDAALQKIPGGKTLFYYSPFFYFLFFFLFVMGVVFYTLWRR